ncbi:MAG: hypothetical protein QOB17_07930, partial [Nitrososphaeraceae archaeon]|nr:hypothetical protein [Nitrososphaeraceae archaeon]
MNLEKWCRIDETLYSAETNEQYLQFAGYDYDRKNIEYLAKMKVLISEIFVRTFSQPKTLLLSSIENISESKTKPLELKLHELRGTKVKSKDFKFNGKQVNWNNWRQFNSYEKSRKDKTASPEAKVAYMGCIGRLDASIKRIEDMLKPNEDKPLDKTDVAGDSVKLID